MIAVNQTRFHTDTTRGNCLRACVASMLEIGIDDMPAFEESEDTWGDLAAWVWERGYELHRTFNKLQPPDSFNGYSIAMGWCERGGYHACIALDGDVVFDPHPSRAGLTDVFGYAALIPCQES